VHWTCSAWGDREVLVKGLRRAGREHVDHLLRVARIRADVGEDLARVPVVRDLVVVPLHDDRCLRVEAAEILVEQVVPPLTAELRQASLLGGTAAAVFALEPQR
jgi:hypothetical protein